MGRGIKQIIDGRGVDKRLSGYYSTPRFVADFIAEELLRINPNGKRVLDPCVGQEELHDTLSSHGLSVDSFDVEKFAINYNSNYTQKDFLEVYADQKSQCILNGRIDLDYDYYVANPPYNCHEVEYIRHNKDKLKILFSRVGVHNMYSMFISAMIDSAKDGALIGIITLDSFLTSRAHHGLRKQILEECSVHTLLLCPTDLFWGQKSDVRTCILILQKGKMYQGTILTANRARDSETFRKILRNRALVPRALSEVVLNNKQDLDEFVVGCPSEVLSLFKNVRLGELFRCVTGISTGNDSEYVSPVRKKGFSVPFYKNPGINRFYTRPNGYLTDDFLELDKRIANYQVRNKDILFKEGITCSSMGVPFTACYLPLNSTFGVNSNIICSHKDIWWLMGYLNSSLVTYFVRGVLLRTNMITSGYVSRIPVVRLSDDSKQRIASISKMAYESEGKDSSAFVSKIDRIVFQDIKTSQETQNYISEFCSDLLRLT